MRQAVLTPTWFPTESYVSSKLRDVDKTGRLWNLTAEYLDYLAERSDMPKIPEAYRLLAENARRVLTGEPIQWSVEAFGYPKAKELGKLFVIPLRGQWILNDDGTPVNRFGGISDGDYVGLALVCIPRVYNPTFEISNMDNIRNYGGPKRLKGERPSFSEQLEGARRSGLPYHIIEIQDEPQVTVQ